MFILYAIYSYVISILLWSFTKDYDRFWAQERRIDEVE